MTVEPTAPAFSPSAFRSHNDAPMPKMGDFARRRQEFYWTVTRALGLGFLHDGSSHARTISDKLILVVLKLGVGKMLERLGTRFDVRIVKPASANRIGHLALDTDGYVKQRLLSGRTRRPLYVLNGDVRAANRCLLDYWRKYVHVVEGRAADHLLFACPGLVDDLAASYASVIEGCSPCYTIEAKWGTRAPLLQINADHAARGQACLRRMGLPTDAWFVCVHARGDGYSPVDEHVHSYRNTPVDDYFPAMREIVDRGGWCVRMGDSTMTKLPPLKNVVDYAHSEHKSDWMDVYLCATARFFLGNNSGIFLLSSVFGVPAALANMAPLATAFSSFPRDISIPRLVVDQTGRPLPFPDVFASPIATMRSSEQFESAGVTLLPSRPDDIVDLTREMIARLDGRYVNTPEDENRQTSFRNLLRPHHYAWGTQARVSDAFLAKYWTLVSPSSVDAPHARV